MDFKSLATVLVFNIITQAIPIGLAVYFGITFGGKRKVSINEARDILQKGIETRRELLARE